MTSTPRSARAASKQTQTALGVDSLPGRLRFQARRSAAFVLGKAAGVASRLLGRGSGESIKGRWMTILHPPMLREVLTDRRIAVVSGTNGKTTTSHLLAAALRAGQADPADVVTNADGANLRHGIVSALVEAPKAHWAVLETDERVVPDVVRLGHPEVLVMLNFSRDQLDRHHEINALGRGWRNVLEEVGDDGPLVIANATDPLICWSAEPAKHVIWIDPGTGWTQDAALCPGCGAILAQTPGAGWNCPDCRRTQPKADYRVDGDTVSDTAGNTWQLELNVPGRFNRGNAACALVAAMQLGVPADAALAGFRTIHSPAGRFATARFSDTTARLLLAKNPAGWAESLALATSDPVILAIDSAIADGRDVSWLWDVDYEQLAGRHVIATGPRAIDLSVRLHYAEVDHTVIEDLAQAMPGHPDGVIDVVATYTAFQNLRKLGGLA